MQDRGHAPALPVERYAPRLAQTFARRPVIIPSLVAAISTSWMWSRPWIVAR